MTGSMPFQALRHLPTLWNNNTRTLGGYEVSQMQSNISNCVMFVPSITPRVTRPIQQFTCLEQDLAATTLETTATEHRGFLMRATLASC